MIRILLLACAIAGPAFASDADSTASYRVRFDPDSSRLVVTARLPLAGTRLRMDSTRPAGIAELDSLGWPGLVTGLTVRDAHGQPLEVARNGAEGWRLSHADTTSLQVQYTVDYTPLARLDWPARREAAYRENDAFVLVGRSLFVTTAASRRFHVEFDLPEGWHAVTPWSPAPRDAGALVENLLVLSRGPREEVTAGPFHLHLAMFGPWSSTSPELFRAIARHHAKMMRVKDRMDYLVVLLPEIEHGGESYRNSFAVNLDSLPSPSMNRTLGNLVAHEMFHLWNGWQLQGADYASSQWFQEGFTEYVANITTAGGGAGSDWLRAKLAQHIATARRLETTLENIGTHKGPPLYSAGALVAFAWDVRIRRLTNGHRDLGDFFNELMRITNGGRRPYAWPDIRSALDATARYDWQADYDSFIRGKGALPLDEALTGIGQRLAETPGFQPRIESIPNAPETAKHRWTALSKSR